MSPTTRGRLYVAGIDRESVIKIGFTLLPINARLSRLGPKGTVHLLRTKPGTWGDERRIHDYLKPFRAIRWERYVDTSEFWGALREVWDTEPVSIRRRGQVAA